jgi:carboxypeptidase C (cathepsin A)
MRLPHRADDTSEAAKKHRSCQVDGLVRQCLAASCGLTRAQKRENGTAQAKGHQVLDRKSAVTQQERAVKCALCLQTVARKMEDVCVLSL